MEILQNIELTTPIGIASLTTLFLEMIKRQYLPNLYKGHPYYSLLILGLSFGTAGILSGVAIPIFSITPQEALYNWLYGWMGATFGFQLVKGVMKIIKKKP